MKKNIFILLFVLMLINYNFAFAEINDNKNEYSSVSDKSKLEQQLNGRELSEYIRENQERFDRNYEALRLKINMAEKMLNEKRVSAKERGKVLVVFDKMIDEFIKSKIFMKKELEKLKIIDAKKDDLTILIKVKKDIQLIEERIKLNENITNEIKVFYKKLADYNPPNDKKRREEREDMNDFIRSVDFINRLRR